MKIKLLFFVSFCFFLISPFSAFAADISNIKYDSDSSAHVDVGVSYMDYFTILVSGSNKQYYDLDDSGVLNEFTITFTCNGLYYFTIYDKNNVPTTSGTFEVKDLKNVSCSPSNSTYSVSGVDLIPSDGDDGSGDDGSGDDGSGDDGSGDGGSGDDGSGDGGSGDDGSGDVEPTPAEVCGSIVCECIESLKQVNNIIRDVLLDNGVKLDSINSNLTNVNSKLNDVNSNLISIGFKLNELNTTADLILGEMRTNDTVNNGSVPTVPVIDSSGMIERNKPQDRPVFEDDTIYFEDQGDAQIPDALPQVPDPAECWDAVGTQCKEPDGTPEKELSKDSEQNLDNEFNIDDELEKEDFSLEDELQKDNFSKENELEKDLFNQTEKFNQTNDNFSKTHEYEQTHFYD